VVYKFPGMKEADAQNFNLFYLNKNLTDHVISIHDLCVIDSFDNDQVINVFSVSCQFRLVWYSEGDIARRRG
jgi:hypothetical protein